MFESPDKHPIQLIQQGQGTCFLLWGHRHPGGLLMHLECNSEQCSLFPWAPFSYFLIVHSTLWASDLVIAEILLLPEGNDLFCYPWMPFCWENEKLGNLMNFPTVHISHQLFLRVALLIILKGTAILLFRLPTCQWNQLSAVNVHRRDNYRADSWNKRGCFIFLIPWRVRYFI